MTDNPQDGDRGTVKPGGTIRDRNDFLTPTLVVGLLIVQFVLMTVAVAVGAIIVNDIADAAAKATTATMRLDGAVRGSCERVQDERERSNVIEASLYQTLSAAAVASRDAEARRIYSNQAKASAWSPPTNCDRAVNDPANYRAPRAIPFKDLPPNFAERLIAAAQHGQPQPLPRR